MKQLALASIHYVNIVVDSLLQLFYIYLVYYFTSPVEESYQARPTRAPEPWCTDMKIWSRAPWLARSDPSSAYFEPIGDSGGRNAGIQEL